MNFTITLLLVLVLLAAIIPFVVYSMTKKPAIKRLISEEAIIENIYYTNGDLRLEFQKKDGEWRMVQPDSWEANHDKMRKLVSRLVTLDIIKVLPFANPEKSDYGIGTNGELTLDGSERVSISIGVCDKNDEELVYIRKTDTKGVMLVHSSLLSVLPQDVSSFKNMLLFDGLPSQIDSVEAGTQDIVYLLIRGENCWTMLGRNLFDENVKPFLEKVLALEAEGFVDESFKLPPKQTAYATLKINKKTVARNFFDLSDDDDYYLVPVDAKLLKIKKVDVDFIFSFK